MPSLWLTKSWWEKILLQCLVGKNIVAIFWWGKILLQGKNIVTSLLLQPEKRGVITIKNIIQRFVGSVFFGSPLYKQTCRCQ